MIQSAHGNVLLIIGPQLKVKHLHAGHPRRRGGRAGEGRAAATDAPTEAAAASAVLELLLRCPARQAAPRLQRRQFGRRAAEAGEDVVVPEGGPAPDDDDDGVLRGRPPAPDGHAAAPGEGESETLCTERSNCSNSWVELTLIWKFCNLARLPNP